MEKCYDKGRFSEGEEGRESFTIKVKELMSIMSNLRCRFRQAFACILTAGMVAGGMNFTALPVFAEEMAAVPAAIEEDAAMQGGCSAG